MATRTGKKVVRAKGRDYIVQERDTFAAILNEAILSRYDGNRNAAAKAVGIPYTTLKRYLEQRGAAVRHETIERLRKLVGGGHASRLEAALLSPLARRVIDHYDHWVIEETRALEWGSIHTNRVAAIPSDNEAELESKVAKAIDRGTQLWQLVQMLRRRFPKEWKPLQSHLTKRGHFNPRARLAFLRVVEPLSAADETWGVERSWREFSDQEIMEFIKAGVARERILLDRETDIRRAQEEALRMQDDDEGIWDELMRT